MSKFIKVGIKPTKLAHSGPVPVQEKELILSIDAVMSLRKQSPNLWQIALKPEYEASVKKQCDIDSKQDIEYIHFKGSHLQDLIIG
jgi:hypothetical protein